MRTAIPSSLEVTGRVHPDADTWILYFAWPTNPLPMNGSRGGNWRPAARKRAAIRNHVFQMATFARIPALGRIRAQVTWWVTSTAKTRDPDNLALLEKPMFDALVDAGIVTDDRPDLMDKPRAVIRPIADSAGLITAPGFTLTITRLGDPA
jgi:hypothetical protein